MAKECEKQNRGMVSFVLGKDFSPDMNHEQSVMLSVYEKLALSDQLKKYQDDSALESVLETLHQI